MEVKTIRNILLTYLLNKTKYNGDLSNMNRLKYRLTKTGIADFNNLKKVLNNLETEYVINFA